MKSKNHKAKIYQLVSKIENIIFTMNYSESLEAVAFIERYLEGVKKHAINEVYMSYVYERGRVDNNSK